MKTILFSLLATLFLLSNCANGQSSYKNVSQADFKAKFEGKADVQILDVRTNEEIVKGKIGNALELNYFDPDFKNKIETLQLDKSKPLVVYCAAGGRSSKAAQILIDLGFVNVYNLEGGFGTYR